MCGDAAVQPYFTKQICISLWYDVSRENGGVADDEFIVGISKEKIEQIMRVTH